METQSSTPSLLVAMPQLLDPNFRHVVILLTDHNKEGALGYVINKPSVIALSEVIKIQDKDIPEDYPVWFGGPVSLETGLVLHNRSIEGDDKARIIGGTNIRLTSSKAALNQLADYTLHGEHYFHSRHSTLQPLKITNPENKELYPFRFLIGYAGWAPHQLDEELRLGGWMQVPVDEKIIFATPWTDMWETAIASVGADPMELAPVFQPYLN